MKKKLEADNADKISVYCDTIRQIGKALKGADEIIDKISYGIKDYTDKGKEKHKAEVNDMQRMIEDL